MQFPKFPQSAGQLRAIQYGSFPGYSLADDPGELPPGFLVAGSQDIDLTRYLGALAKRRGIEAQITTPPAGATGTKGIFTYRKSSGDEVLFGHGEEAYKLSGSEQTLTKTSQSDFVLGAMSNVDTPGDDVQSLQNFGADTVATLSAASQQYSDSDGTYLYIPHRIALSATKISKVRLSDLSVIATLTLNAADQFPYNLAVADGYGYVALNTVDGASNKSGIVKINLSTMVKEAGWGYLASALNPAVAADSSHAYFGQGGRIRKIDVSSGAEVATYLAGLYNATDCIMLYDGMLYVGGNTSGNTFKIVKVQASDMALQTSLSLSAGERMLAFCNDGTYLYGVSSSKVLKVRMSDLTLVASLTLPTAEQSGISITHNGGLLYVGITSGVVKIRAATMQRLTSVPTDESTQKNIYTDGTSVFVGGADTDLHKITIAGNYTTSGTWTSPAYDLTTTPLTATLAWTETVPAGTDITLEARASEDGQNWGDYEPVTSGGSIPRGRYIQTKFTLTGTTAATPTLSDFTITYTTAMDTATSIISGLSGNRLRMSDYEDIMYFAEGGRPQRYDGTTVSNVGFADDELPTAPTLTASATAGNPNGAYTGLVTFVNAYGCESNGGAVSAVVNPTSDKIDWTNIPVDATGRAVARKLYRTKASGLIYYYVTIINDNTTTTYSGDNLTDTDLEVAPELELDNDAPPDSNIVLTHKTYTMYVPNDYPARLYFSKPGLPDSVPSDAYKQFPGHIKGAKTYADALVVGGDNFTAVIYGSVWDASPTIDTTVTKVLSEFEGPVSHESMVQCYSSKLGDILVFPTRYGLKYLTPGFQENSIRSTPLSYRVQELFDQAVNRQNMAAIFWKDRLFVAINHYGSGTPVLTNNKIMVYDFRTEQWSPPWNISANGFCIANNKAYIGDSDSGQVFELEKGADDDGFDIHAIAVIRPEYANAPHLKKRFRQLRVSMSENSDTTSLELKPAIDGTSSTLTPGALSTWGALTSPRQKINLPRGYKYQLTIEDDSALDWVMVDIVTEYERGE